MNIIYLLKNSIDSKMYVGCTKNLNKRLYRHSLAKEGHLIAQAIHKDGIKCFEMYVLDCDEDRKKSLEKERNWTIALNTLYPNGYNLRAGSKEWTQVVKEKIAKPSAKKKKSQETILKLRKANEFRAKKIRCVETGVVFESMSECCRKLNLNKGHLAYFFRGLTKSVKGFTFERIA